MDSYEQCIIEVQTAGITSPHAQEVFDTLIEQFQEAAFRWAVDALGDPLLAQDATQDAFLTAYRNIDQLREPRAFPGWLRRIVLTQCHRLTRGQHVVTRPLDDDADLVPESHDPAAEVEERERNERLRRAVDDLPEHERTVTELHYLTGLSQREIAEALGLPLTTIKKRLQYAREHLREAMPDEPMCALFSFDVGFDAEDDIEDDPLLLLWRDPFSLFEPPEPVSHSRFPNHFPTGIAVLIR